MIVTVSPSPLPLRESASTAKAPIRYPDNAKSHRVLVPPRTVEDKLGIGAPGSPLHIVSITLERWSVAHDPGFQMYTIGPNRLVYRVVTSFDKPVEVKGNRWSSGTRTFLVDAETGDVLLSATTGNLVHSAHIRTPRQTP